MPSADQEENKASAESTELDPTPKRRRRKKKINSNDATPNDESTIAAPMEKDNSATEVPLEKEKREPSIVKQESRKAKKKKKKGNWYTKLISSKIKKKWKFGWMPKQGKCLT